MGSNALISAAAYGAGLAPLLPGRSVDEFWCDPTGSGDGRNLDHPLPTITRAIAAATSRAASFNRSTIIHLAPGEYRELVDITKPDIFLLGSARYPGRTRIVGDGATVQPTVRVLAPNLRGFGMANIFVETGYPDSTTVAAPAIMLETDDSIGGDSSEVGANSQNYNWSLDNVMVISDGTTTAGLLLAGATNGRVTRCTFAGCVHGVVFASSRTPLNTPSDVHFEEIHFRNNTTTDVNTSDATPPTITTGTNLAEPGSGLAAMDSITWNRIYFEDVGGTPVTNYINMVGTQINGTFFDCFFNRTVSDGTLVLLPVGVNIIGSNSPGGAVNIVGA